MYTFRRLAEWTNFENHASVHTRVNWYFSAVAKLYKAWQLIVFGRFQRNVVGRLAIGGFRAFWGHGVFALIGNWSFAGGLSRGG